MALANGIAPRIGIASRSHRHSVALYRHSVALYRHSVAPPLWKPAWIKALRGTECSLPSLYSSSTVNALWITLGSAKSQRMSDTAPTASRSGKGTESTSNAVSGLYHAAGSTEFSSSLFLSSTLHHALKVSPNASHHA